MIKAGATKVRLVHIILTDLYLIIIVLHWLVQQRENKYISIILVVIYQQVQNNINFNRITILESLSSFTLGIL